MPPSIPVLKAKGLHTADNQLASLPEGAMSEADDIVIQSADIAESRRGQKFIPYTFGTADKRSSAGTFYKGSPFIHHSLNRLARDIGTAFVDMPGAYLPPDPDLLRMKFLKANGRMYFTSSGGVKRMDTDGSTPVDAGGLRALIDWNASRMAPDAAGFLVPGRSVAYRATIVSVDPAGKEIEGPPSGRMILLNPTAIVAAIGDVVRTSGTRVSVSTGTTAHNLRPGDQVTITSADANYGTLVIPPHIVTDVADAFHFVYSDTFGGTTTPSTATVTFNIPKGNGSLVLLLPDGITTSHIIRVYRSEIGTAAAPPSDELLKVYEANPSASDIIAKSFSFVDTIPAVLLGEPLYSNPSQEGGVQANEPPPMAKDICSLNGYTFYFNTVSRHLLEFTVIATGGSAGLVVGDTMTITQGSTSFTITGATASSATAYLVTNTGDVGLDNARTAQSIVAAINTHTGNTFCYAEYVSADTGLPGMIAIRERVVGGAAFSVTVSAHAGAYSPGIPLSGTTFISKNDAQPNGVFVSKLDLPDAVPILNNFLIHQDEDQAIIRGLRLKDKIYCFTLAGAIYVISYTGAGLVPFRADELDGTASLIGPDTAVAHSSQIWALTTQGVATISDVGVRVMSRPIEDSILGLFGVALDNVKKLAFGVSYDSDRQYQLWLPADETSTCCTQAFVYNSFTDAWVRWTGNRTWGGVHPTTNKLYMGDGASNKVRIERKTYTRNDYADETFPVTVVSHSGKSVVLSSVVGIAAGDMLYQTDSTKALVVTVTAATNTLTVLTTEGWVNGDPTDIWVAIRSRGKWAPVTAGQPGLKKQFRQATYHFQRFFVSTFQAFFDTDVNQGEVPAVRDSPGFGLQPFGTTPFGFQTGPKNRPSGVPIEHQRATQIRVGFEVREALSIWAINGFTLDYEPISERTAR